MTVESVENPTVVSYSEISAARFCGLQHQLAYRERWYNTQVGGARALGTAWHLVQEAQYKELQRIQADIRAGKYTGLYAPKPCAGQVWEYPAETADRVHHAVHNPNGIAAGVICDKRGDYTENGKLLEWMLTGYTQRYGLDNRYTILAVEYTPVAPLPSPDGSPSRYSLKCKIDLVVLDLWTGRIEIWDHKSGQRQPSQRSRSLDEQFGLYTWILRSIGRPVLLSRLSWTKTTRPKKPDTLEDRFIRYPDDRSDHELDQIARDAYVTCQAVYETDWEALGGFQVNPSPEWCTRRCDYVNAHMAERRGIAPLRAYLTDTGFVQNLEKVR